MQLAYHLGDLRVDAVDVGFFAGVAAELDDLLFKFFEDLLGEFFDAGGVDAAVFEQSAEGLGGGGPADRIEAGNDHDAGGIVDHHVHTGGGLEGADVAALPADDPAFHGVVFDLDGVTGRFGRVFGSVALDRGERDFLGDLFGFLLGALGDLLDELAGLVSQLIFEDDHGFAFGVFLGEVGDPQQVVLEGFLVLGIGLLTLDQQGLGFVDFAVDRGLLLFDLAVEIQQVFFFGGEGVEFLVQQVFTLGQPPFLLGGFVAEGVGFFFESFAALGLGVAGVEFELLGEGFTFAAGFGQHIVGLTLGILGRSARLRPDQGVSHRETAGQRQQDQNDGDRDRYLGEGPRRVAGERNSGG